MQAFGQLLRNNRNYRLMWVGQLISEVGDHFNTIAVFSLALANTGSGMVVSGIMLSRAVPFLFAGPLAGVMLDRLDRRHLMILSDLVRAGIALLFLFATHRDQTWLLFLLSGLLMFASPFFTSGRASILPTIAQTGELHTANALTQTTSWSTTAIGGMLAGFAVSKFGYEWAFILNALSFVISGMCVVAIRPPEGGFRARSRSGAAGWTDFRQGLAYMASVPLIAAIGMIHVGWATGGGAAQVLFGLFGEKVYGLGAVGIGTIWGFAGVGLVCGGILGHTIGPRLSYEAYKRSIGIAYAVHGLAYVAFSQVPNLYGAFFFIALSRAAVAVSSVLNMTQVLTHVADEYRGRVFATLETLVWGVMMLSLTAAGWASEHYSPRTIGLWAGVLSSMTAVYWTTQNVRGRLPEPPTTADVR
jgi:MFS family permease